jgi:Ca2+-binding RTX toxin-like protein
VAAALIVGSLVWVSPTAQAATPKCFGKKATKVGTSGPDTIFGTKKADVIVGLGGDDILLGFDPGKKGSGNDLICAGPGADLVGGGPGNDRMSGGTGDDVLFYGFSAHGVTASLATGKATGEGSDTFSGFKTISGSDFDDNFSGDYGTNFFFGNAGNDQLLGGPPASGDKIDATDIIAPGDGDDVVDGGDGFDMISYQDRPDNTNGTTFGMNIDLASKSATGFGTDSLQSFEAVWGSPQDDTIKGDGQDNYLVPAEGDDDVSGGGGDDYVIFWFAGGCCTGSPTPGFTGITANLENGTATGEGVDKLGSGLEGLFGSILGNDNLTGDKRENLIEGDAGNDTLNGGDGDDYFSGGVGNDTIDGGTGSYDLIDFSFATGPVTANLTNGTATGEGSDTFSNAEALSGSNFGDTLTGDANVNYLFGWFGDDTLNGMEGDDQIDGGPDADTADGGPGANICAESEQFFNCTQVQSTQIQQHPLFTQAEEIANFRRNF